MAFLFHQVVHLVEKARRALDFVDDNPAVPGLGEDFGAECGGISLVTKHHLRVQQVDHERVLEMGADPRALAGSSRAEQKEGRAWDSEEAWKHRHQIYRKIGVDVYSSRYARPIITATFSGILICSRRIFSSHELTSMSPKAPFQTSWRWSRWNIRVSLPTVSSTSSVAPFSKNTSPVASS